jgi:hypothetical protein
MIFILVFMRYHFINGFGQSPNSRRASLAAQGVQLVRCSARGMKRNAEVGLSTKPFQELFILV